MLQAIGQWFAADGFMPHGHCYLWQPSLVWLHVLSDCLIGFSYVAISITLYHLVRIIRIPFSAITLSFGIFIGACSLTHFMEVWNLWHSNYWWGGIVKALTAAASATTAVWLIKLKSQIIAVGHAAEIAEARRVELETLNLVLQRQAGELRASHALQNEQQKLLVHSAKMSALGEMAGGLAHEVNTPLAIITVHAQQLSRCLLDKGTCAGAVEKNAEPIASNAQRIGHIIKGLQLFSREGDDKMLEWTLGATLVDDALLFCKERIKHRQIELRVDYGPVGLGLYCSPRPICHVLLALLINSLEAAGEGGNSFIAIAVRAKDEYVEFTVTDNGHGVAKDIQSRIMLPFFTTKEVGSGPGLGLSVALGVVEQHGGKLRLDTAHPHTHFVLELPVRPQAKEGT